MAKYKLMKGDCLERIKEIEDGSVDMILTDPPYGTTKRGTAGRGDNSREWDVIIPPNAMWKELKRVLKPLRSIVLFSAQPFTTTLISTNRSWFRYPMYWVKNNKMMTATDYQPLRQVEEILVFYNTADNAGAFPKCRAYMLEEREKSGLRAKDINELLGNFMGSHYFTMGGEFIIPTAEAYAKLQGTGYFAKPYAELKSLWERERERERERGVFNPQKQYFDGLHPTNVLKFANKVAGKRFHPCEKPVALLEYLIKTYSNESETVLDFTMGSGSTGVAAMNTGREFIGIERDDKYFQIAEKRIKSAEAMSVRLI